MIRRLLPYFLFILFTILCGKSTAQQYGNEWIQPGQQYFKILTYQNGIYKVSGQELANAGVPLQSWDVSDIQLWHRGVQHNILIKGDSDGKFDLSDTLIFYGKRNDGTLDSLLYKPYSSQPHKFFNLYSDTCAYFLTEGAFPGFRIDTVSESLSELQHSFHWKNEIVVFANTYDEGERESESRNSYFNAGEGWTGPSINKNPNDAPQQRTYHVPLSQIATNGPSAKFEILITGTNANRHNVEILLGDPNSPFLTSTLPEFVNHVSSGFNTLIPTSQLTDTSLSVTVRVNGYPGFADRVAVSFIKLEYPQSIVYTSGTENVLGFSGLADGYILPSPSGELISYDLTNESSISILPSSDKGFYVPTGSNKVIVTNRSLFKAVYKIMPSDLGSLSINNSNIENAGFIIVCHPRFLEGAKTYATYRASLAGGSFDTLVARTDHIYDQFSYGEFSPLGIKNLCRFLADVGKPEHLFLVGKGTDVNYNHFRIGKFYRFFPEAYSAMENTWDYVQNFVPYGGTPTSDQVYVMGIGGKPEYVPAFNIGRINVKYPQEVYNYLEKVKQHESLPKDALWRKNVLHLSGGNTEQQIVELKALVKMLEPIVEDTVFGGKVVKHIVKTLGSYVDDKLIETVAAEVNKGVSYITFLGHASPSVPDIDIGFVTNSIYGYNNSGKYPMLILNGCNTLTGLVPYSLAEDWINTADKGAILTMGHTHAGFAHLLQYYSEVFYEHSFRKRSTFAQQLSVGDVQKNTITELASSESYFIRSMLQQMVLQGDPAIRIYTPEGSDFSTENVFVSSFDNLPVTAASDSFRIAVVVNNYGISSSDSLLISVTRTAGNKVNTHQEYFYPAPNYRDTLYLTINQEDTEVYGLNSFVVTLDPFSTIHDINRSNNTFSFQHFFSQSAVLPLFPKEFSIVNEQPVSFIAQATDLLLGSKSYYIEVDTSAAFNSSFKKSETVNSESLIRWNNVSLLPDINAHDSIVYYWRIRFSELAAGEDTIWGNSSFIYIKNSPAGWSQTTIPQLSKDVLTNLSVEPVTNSLVFNAIQANIMAASPGSLYEGPDRTRNAAFYAQLGLNGDGILFEGRACGAGLSALTLRKSNLVPYFPAPLPICGWMFSGKKVNHFNRLNSATGGGSQAQLIQYIDSVRSGDYVFIMTTSNVYESQWSTLLKDKLKNSLGAKLVDSLSSGMPYILLAKKDSSAPIVELYGQSDDIIYLNHILNGKHASGTVSTPLIGPSSSWSKFYKTFEEKDIDDYYNMMLLGVNLTGKVDTLITDILEDSLDISHIDAAQYPYIKLIASLGDSIDLSPLAIKKWQVIYEGVPEGTMDLTQVGKEQFNYSIKQEGQDITFNFEFSNISSFPFQDSLRVKFSITNSGGKTQNDTITLFRLPADSSLKFSYTLNTLGWAGDNLFQAYVNPQLLPEEYYNNNILQSSFKVEVDKTNPLLDVTFDGNHIMEGDIVSPSPYITISLRDENDFLIKKDTTGMQVFHKKPGAAQFQPVNFSSPDVISWGQASAKGNNFKIEYNPKRLEDGIHTLRVQGSDVSGNRSGSQPYEINFEVINESSITNFYPYPNPFSSKTQFVFTLTGSKIPEDLKIQIMTVTGKVVREITKAELGLLRIGHNITDYAWDGRDEYGDQLANGVYLYRVVIKGQDEFKHRKTSADHAFKKNFGKIYLLK